MSSDAFLDFCVCPDCQSPLEREGVGLRCTAEGRTFAFKGGVPVLMPMASGDVEQRYLANYETIATDDLAKPLEGNRAARHEKLRDFIGDVSGKRVLDIGSSDATYLRQLEGGVKVAFDIAIEYLDAIPPESGVMAVCGDAEHLPIRAGYFDVIIISDVLEHVLHPEAVVNHLRRVCRPDTRLIVHVPWEEDLSQYKDVAYEFTHLRSFNAFNFSLLFTGFQEVRSRGTYPYLNMPLPYRLYGRIPRWAYNVLMLVLQRTRLGPYSRERWLAWVAELPRRERRLLLFYRPIFRQFEFRLWAGSPAYRTARWMRRLRRPNKT